MSNIINTDVETLKEMAKEYKAYMVGIDKLYEEFIAKLEGNSSYEGFEELEYIEKMEYLHDDEATNLMRRYNELKEELAERYSRFKSEDFTQCFNALLKALNEYNQK